MCALFLHNFLHDCFSRFRGFVFPNPGGCHLQKYTLHIHDFSEPRYMEKEMECKLMGCWNVGRTQNKRKTRALFSPHPEDKPSDPNCEARLSLFPAHLSYKEVGGLRQAIVCQFLCHQQIGNNTIRVKYYFWSKLGRGMTVEDWDWTLYCLLPNRAANLGWGVHLALNNMEGL